jgi:predicted PP-loop superfamily ATPase
MPSILYAHGAISPKQDTLRQTLPAIFSTSTTQVKEIAPDAGGKL